MFDATGLRAMLAEWYATDTARRSVADLLEPLDELGPRRAAEASTWAAGVRLGLSRTAGRGGGGEELGLSGRPEIVDFGIDEFNEACRTCVLRYTSEWERYVTRQARWVDFDNDYKTLDLPYMESVMWAFKTLWDKGLVYEGFRVLAYCWRCETPLSQHRDADGRRLPRPAGPGAHRVVRAGRTGERRDPLAWTTTPWTLPSNLALAVGPDIDYAVIEEDGAGYVLAEARSPPTSASSAGATRSARSRARAGRPRYTPLFAFFVDQPDQRAFQVLAADFVTTEDGTGVVHLAPGFGEDDQNVCNADGIPTGGPDGRAQAASPR